MQSSCTGERSVVAFTQPSKRANTIVLPQSVKQELVDDVLDNNDAPANHRASAQSVQALSDDGSLIGEFVSVDDFGHREVLLDHLDFNG